MRTIGLGLTDIGRERAINEDALLIDDDLGIYAVSDGLGGHAAGEEASRLAIEAVRETVRAGRDGLVAGENEALRELAARAMREACASVHAQAMSDPELSGMGCTLTLLVTSGAKAAMAHVGDTRLYVCREGSTWQLSTDHTIAAELVRRGEITRAEADVHPYSHALTRALGSQESVQPEILVLDLLPDDVFLLCSDGLSHYIEGPGELSSLLNREDHEDTPRELIRRANERGGRDNITAVVVQITATEAEQEAALTADLRAGIRALRNLAVFKDRRFADVLRIFMACEMRSYRRGETILREGRAMNAMYLPLAGDIEITGEEGRTNRLAPGDALGTTSLLVPRRSMARVMASSNVRVLEFDGAALHELARRRPRLGVSVFTALAEELRAELGDHRSALPRHGRAWWSLRRWLG